MHPIMATASDHRQAFLTERLRLAVFGRGDLRCPCFANVGCGPFLVSLSGDSWAQRAPWNISARLIVGSFRGLVEIYLANGRLIEFCRQPR